MGDTSQSKLNIKLPSEALPAAGTLYRDGENRYLAVLNWEEIEQGRTDAKRLKATLCAARRCFHEGRTNHHYDRRRGKMSAKTSGLKGETCIEELEALLSELAELDDVEHTRDTMRKIPKRSQHRKNNS